MTLLFCFSIVIATVSFYVGIMLLLGHSVSIVRSQTKGHRVFFIIMLLLCACSVYGFGGLLIVFGSVCGCLSVFVRTKALQLAIMEQCVLMIKSNMGLCMITNLSFICCFCLLRLYM
jgi:hypothetical protein